MNTMHVMIGLIAARMAFGLLVFAVVVYLLVHMLGVLFSVLWVAAPYLIVAYILYVLIWNRIR